MSRRTRATLLAIGAVALLVISYVALWSTMGKRSLEESHSVTFTFAISEPKFGESSPIFEARQGDALTLKVSSTRPGSVHVHGYEVEVALVLDAEVNLTFTADNAGLFPVHLHDPTGSMRHVATLKIEPR